MRHIRFQFISLASGGAICAVAAGVMAGLGHVALAILFLLAASICFAVMASVVRRPVAMMTSFVSALECDDRTMLFDVGSDDPQLSELAAGMDRVMGIYRGAVIELETRKLYYDRILRVMTHEMRNSITPVISLAQDYSRCPDKYDSGMLAETMEVIGTQAESIRKFLDSYYNLTHLPDPRRQPVDAGLFVRRIRTLVRLEEKRRGFVKEVCSYSVPLGLDIFIDEDLMAQAFMNIIRNALDAVAGVADAEVSVLISSSDGIPFATVADNGCGISDTVRDNLFQPFFSTKAGGSGIGLSLSRQIARLHGGDISVSPGHPRGTVVTMSLG